MKWIKGVHLDCNLSPHGSCSNSCLHRLEIHHLYLWSSRHWFVCFHHHLHLRRHCFATGDNSYHWIYHRLPFLYHRAFPSSSSSLSFSLYHAPGPPLLLLLFLKFTFSWALQVLIIIFPITFITIIIIFKHHNEGPERDWDCWKCWCRAHDPLSVGGQVTYFFFRFSFIFLHQWWWRYSSGRERTQRTCSWQWPFTFSFSTLSF